MNQPKTYTAASNQRYILRELWHYDRSTIFYALAEIITQIGKGFGTILIPSMIVAFLEQYQKGMITQETLPGAVAKLVTFFVGYSIWCIITGYLKRRNQFQYVKFRCGTMIEFTYQKYMSLDYVQCEDEKVQQLLKKAMEAIRKGDAVVAETVFKNKKKMHKAEKKYSKAHLNRVKNEVCDASMTRYFSGIMYNFDRMADNCVSIAEEACDNVAFINLDEETGKSMMERGAV